MNKENNKSAAGLRRSAIVERIRLREEWSALKGVENARNILKPKSFNKKITKSTKMPVTSDVLSGIVALVEVGVETKALALRAALSALGATVVQRWSPLVTHLVWSEGGCRATRAKARALASRLVSPLWVEGCAAANSRLAEYAFPAAARASDLPSPRTLRRLLKQAEMQNVPLIDLLRDSNDDQEKSMRLRMSSETDGTTMDTSADTSHNKSTDTSHDKSRDKTVSKTKMSRPINEVAPKKCKRKLFTQKDGDLTTRSDDETDDETPRVVRKLTHKERREVARAGRVARRLAAPLPLTQPRDERPNIVLTGMSRLERHTVFEAVKKLNGKIQKCVNKKTTHILLGSCISEANLTSTEINPSVMTGIVSTGITCTVPRCDKKGRTMNALEGAVRGCRVLYAQWAIDSALENTWLHHNGYEVAHLKKISQKARVERKALCRMHSEYAFDVFYGMRVRVMPRADQKDAVIKLLTLCGAIVHVQDGGAQNSGEFDITIGKGEGEINSKWVFDSVVAARMRTTRRYVNISSANNDKTPMRRR